MNLDDYVASRQDVKPRGTYNKTKNSDQNSWTPGVQMDGDKGTITTKASKDGSPNWNEWIDYWLGEGASERFYIKENEPVNFRVWDSWGENGVQKFYYYKANLYAKVTNRVNDKEFNKLLSYAKRKKPVKKTKTKNKECFVICLSDWQVGKEGTEEMLKRYYESLDRIKEHINWLRNKYTLDKLVIVGLGDLVESCSGHYPMQTFTTVLDGRQQMTLARKMLLDCFTTFSPMFNDVLGLCALGNHGEKRTGSKAYTTFGDNLDGELFDQVVQICKADPSLQHVKFTIPNNDLAYSVEVLPKVVITVAHGHQARRGATPQNRVENWFNKMASKPSKSGFYESNLLLVGHYHHHWTKEVDRRLLLGANTQDSGSQWFEESGGEESLPGTTTLVLHNVDDFRKWTNIEVL